MNMTANAILIDTIEKRTGLILPCKAAGWQQKVHLRMEKVRPYALEVFALAMSITFCPRCS